MAKPIDQMTLEEIDAELAQKKMAQPKAPEQMSLEEIDAELADIEARKVSPMGATLVGAAQGLTFGFSDELKAGLRAAGAAATGKGEFGPMFEKFKEEERDLVRRASEQRPVTTAVSEIGGAIATGGPLGLAKGGLKAGIAKAAGAGATLGAGKSEADIGTREFAEDVVKGGTICAVAEGGLRGIGKVLRFTAPSNIKRIAETRAVKSFRPTKKVQETFEELGKTEQIGRQILDDKILSLSPAKTLERAVENKKNAGQLIGKAVKRVDDVMEEAKNLVKQNKLMNFVPAEKDGFLVASDGTIVTKKAVLNKMDEVFSEPYKRIAKRLQDLAEEIELDPSLKPQRKRLLEIAEDYAEIPNTKATMERLRKFKTNAGKITKFDSEAVPQTFKKRIYSIIREEMEDGAAKVQNIEDTVLGGKINLDDILNFNAMKNINEADDLIQANRLFGRRSDIEKIAKHRAGQAASNRTFGFTEQISGLGGIGLFSATGNPLSLAAPLLANIVKNHGNAAAAISLDKLAKNGARLTGTKFAQAITEAAQNGPNALIATHMALMANEPEYKKLIKTEGLAGAMQPQMRTPMLGGR